MKRGREESSFIDELVSNDRCTHPVVSTMYMCIRMKLSVLPVLSYWTSCLMLQISFPERPKRYDSGRTSSYQSKDVIILYYILCYIQSLGPLVCIREG